MKYPPQKTIKGKRFTNYYLLILILLSLFTLPYCSTEEDAAPETGDNPGGELSGNFDYGSAYDLTNIDIPVNDNFADGESQFFKFYFDKVCLIDIDIYNAPVRFRVKVYKTSENNSVIYRSSYIDVGEDANWTVGPMDIGDHYIELEPYNASDTADKFGIKVTIDCSDQTEFNNTFNSATLIPNDGTPFFGRILAENDKSSHEDFDILKFNIENSPAIVSVEFTAPENFSLSTAKTEIGLYNEANDDSRLEYVRVGKGETGHLYVGPLEIGEHYLAVNYGGYCNCQSKDPYRVIVNLDQRDTFEYNDNQAWGAKDVSQLVNNDLPIRGMLSYPNKDGIQDVDWFVFEPAISGVYNFQLISLNTPQNTYLQLYDELTNSSNYLKRVHTDDGDIVTFEWELEAGTEYWLSVGGVSSNTESDEMYTVTVNPM